MTWAQSLPMMLCVSAFLYKRQKLLVTLAVALGGEVTATDFQKLLFLYTQCKEKKKSFDFVPYKFGCFSFQSYADRIALISKGILRSATDDCWELSANAESVIACHELKVMKHFVSCVHPQRGDELIRKTYLSYPFYATRSEIIKRILSDKERKKVSQCVNDDTSEALFTLGYEGDSIDGYLNKLIRNNIALLVDVRRNPLSRKQGFQKNSFKPTPLK